MLVSQFTRETGVSVSISSGSTGKLYSQIVHGAPYDVFFAANIDEPLRLETHGYTVNGRRDTYAFGKLVLLSNKRNNLATDWRAALIENTPLRIAIANPEIAPYGRAAEDVLSKLDLLTNPKLKIIRAENVGQAFAFAATGNVDFAFVALSQVKSQAKSTLNYWIVPPEYYTPIAQQMVLLKRAKANPGADKFYQFLLRDTSKSTIEGLGYGTSVEVK